MSEQARSKFVLVQEFLHVDVGIGKNSSATGFLWRGEWVMTLSKFFASIGINSELRFLVLSDLSASMGRKCRRRVKQKRQTSSADIVSLSSQLDRFVSLETIRRFKDVPIAPANWS